MTTRELLARFGPCAPQPASAWTGEVPLPRIVADFYERVGPLGEPSPRGHDGLSIPTHGNDVWLPPLARLWDLQSGYRWHGLTGERLDGWPDAWLVLASQGGDPLVLDTGTGELSLLQHGAGSWEGGWALPGGLEDVLGAIALLGGLIEDADEARFTEDYDLRPEWVAATTSALRERFGATGAEVAEALLG